MEDEPKLNPEDAEAVVDELIQNFGPGAFPKVNVSEVSPGKWRIEWRAMKVTAAAMTSTQWTEWLRQRVGSIAPERLETSEG